MYNKLQNSVHSRRRLFEDGRVTDQVEFWVQTNELQVWASGPDWRAAIDVAVQAEPGGSFNKGIIRLYARTGNTRALVKQGRWDHPPKDLTKLTLSTRSVPCDEMIITAQAPQAATPPLTEKNKVRLSVAMHGFEPSPEIADIVASTEVIEGGLGAGIATISPEGFPAFLYSLYATLDSGAAATEFIWVSSDSAMGLPLIPPIPIAPGGVASLDLTSNPLWSGSVLSGTSNPGLFVGLSTTYSSYTQSTDSFDIRINYT